MAPPISDVKAALRKRVRTRLDCLTAAARAAGSAQICRRMCEVEDWHNAGSVLLFSPRVDEPDITPLLRAALLGGKQVALPWYDPDAKSYGARLIRDPAADVVSGQFGIPEPQNSCPLLALNRLDLVLAPGVVFDLHGRRLGRGRGFYDQLLANVHGTTCGVLFDEQIVEEIPMEPHDVPLNRLLTPTRWIEP